MAGRYCFYVGLEKDRDGRSIRNCPARVKKALKKAARIFGGYSMVLQSGGWLDGKGKLVKERSMKVEVLGSEGRGDRARVYGDFLRRAFRQEVVVVTREEVRVEFFKKEE